MLEQSLGARHFLALAQGPHVPPPQSTSVSAPFATVSIQVAVWHTLAVQTPLRQSAAATHRSPEAQSPH
jgi:hypothetical protein